MPRRQRAAGHPLVDDVRTDIAEQEIPSPALLNPERALRNAEVVGLQHFEPRVGSHDLIEGRVDSDDCMRRLGGARLDSRQSERPDRDDRDVQGSRS
jgi:hypothetical protein